jgi:hypothetical protein
MNLGQSPVLREESELGVEIFDGESKVTQVGELALSHR